MAIRGLGEHVASLCRRVKRDADECMRPLYRFVEQVAKRAARATDA